MAAITPECEFCQERYDTDDHKPIELPCGHTFCKTCLLIIEREAHAACPTCGQRIDLQLPANCAFFPINRVIMDGATCSESSEQCKIHKCLLDSFCVNCGTVMCIKCARKFHVEHRIEGIEDVMKKDNLATNYPAELQCKIEGVVERLTRSISSTNEVRKNFKEVEQFLQGEEDRLITKKLSITKSLDDWNDIATKSITEMKVLFENLVWLSEENFQILSNDLILMNIKKRLTGLTEVTTSVGELLPELISSSLNQQTSFGTVKAAKLIFEDLPKTTTSSAKVGRDGVAFGPDGQRPSSLTAMWCSTEPALRFPRILELTATLCLDEVYGKHIDSFWRDFGKTHENLLAFIDHQGHQAALLYGFSKDECSKGLSSPQLGVRLTSMEDVTHCAAMGVKPLSVSCIRGLSPQAGSRTQELGWLPQQWHFPDLEDGDIQWAIEILKPHMRKLVLKLPRCRLSEEGFKELFEGFSGTLSVVLAFLPRYSLTIHCEPISVSLETQGLLTQQARWKDIEVLWSLPQN